MKIFFFFFGGGERGATKLADQALFISSSSATVVGFHYVGPVTPKLVLVLVAL